MSPMLKKIQFLLITFALIAIGANAPVRASEVDYFEFKPWVVSVGQPVAIVLKIDDCDVAPTNFSVELRNNTSKFELTNENWNFKQTLSNGTYTASWMFTGKNDLGVKAGYLAFEGDVSGGCAADGIFGEDYRYISKPKDDVKFDYISSVNLTPDLNGLKAGWTPAEGAIKYEVQIRESADQAVWQPVTKTTANQLNISAQEFDIGYGIEYQIRVRPIFKNSKGDWANSNGWWGYQSRIQSWTSRVGDETLTEVTEFESTTEIQFNYRVENCSEIEVFQNPTTVVNEIESRNEFGMYGDAGLNLNEFSNSSEFFNYNFDDSGEDIVVSWQTNLDLPIDTYRWGQYYAVQVGCIRDNLDVQFTQTWPFSEYSYFHIVKDGKRAPTVIDNHHTAHSTEDSITFKWQKPINSAAGPFKYKIYDTNFSVERDDWKLLATTKKPTYTLKNLRPNEYVAIGVVVSNSAGSTSFDMEYETTGIITKVNSSMTKKVLSKKLGIPPATVSISSASLSNLNNSCVVSQAKIKFKAKPGVCAVEYSWNDSGNPRSEITYIWTKK